MAGGSESICKDGGTKMIVNEDKQFLGFDLAKKMSDHLRAQIENGEATDDGATFKPKGGELSEGCRACKSASATGHDAKCATASGSA